MQNLWEGKQVSSPRQDQDFIAGANAFNNGKYDEALKSWDNLIKKYPNEASAYYNRAITNARLNDAASAEKDYKKAIEMIKAGVNEEYISYILEIESLNNDGFMLKAPVNGNMDKEILESINGIIKVTLKYAEKTRVIKGLKRISKPGLRVYAKSNELPKVLNGLGVAIISTSNGIMTDREARQQKLGGEVIAFVW